MDISPPFSIFYNVRYDMTKRILTPTMTTLLLAVIGVGKLLAHYGFAWAIVIYLPAGFILFIQLVRQSAQWENNPTAKNSGRITIANIFLWLTLLPAGFSLLPLQADDLAIPFIAMVVGLLLTFLAAGKPGTYDGIKPGATLDGIHTVRSGDIVCFGSTKGVGSFLVDEIRQQEDGSVTLIENGRILRPLGTDRTGEPQRVLTFTDEDHGTLDGILQCRFLYVTHRTEEQEEFIKRTAKQRERWAKQAAKKAERQ